MWKSKYINELENKYKIDAEYFQSDKDEDDGNIKISINSKEKLWTCYVSVDFWCYTSRS